MYRKFVEDTPVRMAHTGVICPPLMQKVCNKQSPTYNHITYIQPTTPYHLHYISLSVRFFFHLIISHFLLLFLLLIKLWHQHTLHHVQLIFLFILILNQWSTQIYFLLLSLCHNNIPQVSAVLGNI